MQHVLIIGATSAIAEATARLWAEKPVRLHLVARNDIKLKLVAEHLSLQGATVTTTVTDLNATESYNTLLEEAFTQLGHIDTVLIAHGQLPNQEACEKEVEKTLKSIHINALSVIALLTLLAPRMEQQRYGTIVVIGSVAGDRGRRSNYIYGAAKACVAVFTEGFMARMDAAGIKVILIKPGLVDSPMTKDFTKGWLWSSPHRIAADIMRGIKAHGHVIYSPRWWQLIMWIIKCIPSAILKKMTF